MSRTVRVAVWGCGHGELDRVYECLASLTAGGPPVDVLFCCGDFQCARNEADLECMACPPKYRAMHTFYKYYSGERVAPVLTVFVGGNHEAANHLQELPYGGWVAPNMYYMGTSGVVNLGGLRIAGLSGIYKRYNYREGYYERPPYDNDTQRSVFHVREFDVWKLKQVSGRVDVMVTHDWPEGIYNHGDVGGLLRKKKHFADEVAAGALGNPETPVLLRTLQPRFWFAAHLHVKFAAVVPHGAAPAATAVAAGGGASSAASATSASPGDAAAKAPHCTRFLALDKCLPGRDFLQVLDIEVPLEDDGIDAAAASCAAIGLNNVLRFPAASDARPPPVAAAGAAAAAVPAAVSDSTSDAVGASRGTAAAAADSNEIDLDVDAAVGAVPAPVAAAAGAGSCDRNEIAVDDDDDDDDADDDVVPTAAAASNGAAAAGVDAGADGDDGVEDDSDLECMAHAISSRSADGAAAASVDRDGDASDAAPPPAALVAAARFRLQYDLEWLSILQRSHAMMPVGKRYPPLPAYAPPVCREHAAAVLQALQKQHDALADGSGAAAAAGGSADSSAAAVADASGSGPAPHPLAIPLNFCATVPIYSPPYPGAEHGPPRRVPMPVQCGNPQHDVLLRVLGLAHNGSTIAFSAEQAAAAAAAAAAASTSAGAAGGERSGYGGGGRRGGRGGERGGGHRGGGHHHAGGATPTMPMPWQAGAPPMPAALGFPGPGFPPTMMMLMPGGLPFPMPPPHMMMGGQALPFPLPPGMLPSVPPPAVAGAGSDSSAAGSAASGAPEAAAGVGATGAVRSRLSLPPPVHSATSAVGAAAAAPAAAVAAVPQRPAPATFDPSEIDLDL